MQAVYAGGDGARWSSTKSRHCRYRGNARCCRPHYGSRRIAAWLATRWKLAGAMSSKSQALAEAVPDRAAAPAELLRRAADQMECRVEGRPGRDAFYAREGAIVRLDLLGVIGTIAAVGLFVAGQRRGVEFALWGRQ